jgi:hypothetical protein
MPGRCDIKEINLEYLSKIIMVMARMMMMIKTV